MNLKILTLNCAARKEKARYGKGSYILGLDEFLIKIFKEQQYDFILLQEFHTFMFAGISSRIENYKILRMFDIKGNIDSEIAIAYRQSFIIKEHNFYSFADFKKFNSKWPGIFGLLAARFQTPEKELVIGSLHLNPLFHFITRKKEALFLKKCLLEFNQEGLPVVFGGDFNSGLLGEKIRNNKIFAPQFLNVTMDSGTTVDGDYVEPVVLTNQLAVWLAKFGLHIRLKVDHIYADCKTVQENTISCRVLKDRVSDHSPVEVVLTSATTAR